MWRLYVKNDADDSPDMIDAAKGELSLHWSQNQTLHIYAKMQEEELISKLCDIHNVYMEVGEEDALEMIWQEYEKGKDDKNSKLTKIWMDKWLIITLMRNILPMGPHYQHWNELSVHWLASNISVIMGVCIHHECHDVINDTLTDVYHLHEQQYQLASTPCIDSWIPILLWGALSYPRFQTYPIVVCMD